MIRQPSSLTLNEVLAPALLREVDQMAMAVVDGTPLTYGDFTRTVLALQKSMADGGIQKGDRIVILGAPSPNWACTFVAIMTMGAIAVPIMEEFLEADIEHILNHSESKAIFLEDKFYKNLNTPALKKIPMIAILDDMRAITGFGNESNLLSQKPDTLPQSPEELFSEYPVEEEDIAQIIYTSGTTGKSKGVILTHKNLASNVIHGVKHVEILKKGEIVLSLLPLAHTFGSTSGLLSIIYVNAILYFIGKKPTPKNLLGAMTKVRPHIVGGVPLIFEKIYHKQVLPKFQESSLQRNAIKIPFLRKFLYRIAGKKIREAFGGRLKAAIIGGAAINRDVEVFLIEAGIPFVPGYGLTETSPLLTVTPPWKTKLGTVGTVIPETQIKIADPVDKIGEILVKGPQVMKGYFKNEEETGKVFDDEGWLITGDRGYLDKNGYLYIRGRSKNVIIGPSGENIYPEVIEEILNQSLYVEESLVFMKNEKLTALVYPDHEYIKSKHSESTIAQILEGIRVSTNEQVPAFSRIQNIEEQPEPFLKTPTKKIKRKEYVPDYGK